MFNYYKDVVINDVTNTCAVKGNTLIIKRAGNYDLSKIENMTIYKTVGNAGSCATITINPGNFGSNVDYRQIALYIGVDKEFAEYAMPNYAEFGKPVLIETSNTAAADIVSTLKLALPLDNPLYTAEVVDTTKVKITLAKSWMSVSDVKIFEHSTVTDTLTELTTLGTVAITPNVPEFATADWIIENLRFPSYPNVRYAHTYSDETPTRGTVYVQYAFNYKTDRPVSGGLSVANQVVDAVSNHVFFIPVSGVTAFENLLKGEDNTYDPTSVPTAGTATDGKYTITLAPASAQQGENL